MGTRAPYDNGNQHAEWCKLRERSLALELHPDSADDFLTETSAKFVTLMVGAMMVSAHKYGKLANAYPEKVNAIGTRNAVDPTNGPLVARAVEQEIRAALAHLGSMGKRLALYFFGERNPEFGEPGEAEYAIPPGNAEYLVDVANFAMIEFMHPVHPAAHYKATDRDGSPGRVALNALYDKATQLKNTDLLAADDVSSF